MVYAVLQTRAVNDAPTEHREAALTWFVLAYLVGVFGFSLLGTWLIVRFGTETLLIVLLALATSEGGPAVWRKLKRR